MAAPHSEDTAIRPRGTSAWGIDYPSNDGAENASSSQWASTLGHSSSVAAWQSAPASSVSHGNEVQAFAPREAVPRAPIARSSQSAAPPPNPRKVGEAITQLHTQMVQSTSHAASLDIVDYWSRGANINPYCDANSPSKRPPNHLGLGINQQQAPGWVEQLVTQSGADAKPTRATFKHLTGLPDSAPQRSEVDIPKILHEIKEAFMRTNATYGIRNMSRMFRSMDTNNDGCLDPVELQQGLLSYGVDLNHAEMQAVWKHFSRDFDGHDGPHKLDLQQMYRAIVGTLDKDRIRIVQKFWHSLDVDKSGWASIHELISVYDPKNEADVIAGKLNRDDAQARLVASLDKDANGVITEAEFFDFMVDLSAGCDTTADFQKLVLGLFRRPR